MTEVKVHTDAIGVSGSAWCPPPEPKSLLHRWKAHKRKVTCWECEHVTRLTVCKTCGMERGDHNAQQRAAKKELSRRRGKVESNCTVCDGTGQYTDELGRNPFRSCRRCRGWGRVWRAKSTKR